ncbi:MAG: COX15/CtaA family protein [Candidatus Acidiferrales bacterium]
MSTSTVSAIGSRQVPRAVHRFALLTAGCIVLLLIAGALVTSNDAGLAVPDWPLSYGSLMPPMVGGIFYEHGHRMIATVIGLMTIILAVMLARSEPRAWVRKLGWLALGLVIAQGALGGLTVLYRLPPPISTAHATLAQLFFITVLSIALFTGEWWQRNDLPSLEDTGSPKLRTLAVLTSCSIFIQLVLGAGFRHGAFGLMPHEINAAVVLFLAIWTGRTVRKRFGTVKDLRRWGVLLQSVVGTQILLGLAAWWAVVQAVHAAQPTVMYVTLTVIHVLVGALTLATSWMLTLSCFRLIRPAAPDAIKSNSAAARTESSRA